jgi:O-antigen/teichoic acid export membrane protein
MATLKRNIAANLAGGAWVAVLTLIVTPLQINLLGIEAYGLIGLITTLQIMVSVLDLGLASTITRELAGDHSKDRLASQPLLRTAISFYWGIAALIGAILTSFAGEIARMWFKPEGLDIAILARGLQVVAIFLALRWPVALYSGMLAGIQRMDVLNVLRASTASVRLIGGIIVLLVRTDLSAFLVWIAISALIEVFAFAAVCRKILPAQNSRPGFSLGAIRSVWAFSLSMNGLALLAMGITQLDRLLISKMLPLHELGYYSLAYSAATSISLVLSALSSALMPSFATAHAAGERVTLLRRYDTANRVVLFATGSVCFTLMFFGEPLLRVWVNPGAAAGAWRSLAFLAAGFWLSAAVSNAYSIGVACRKPGLLLRISALSALIYVPGLYAVTLLWGIEGAAVAWLLLNSAYVLAIVPIVHRAVLDIAVASWFSDTLLPFALLGITTFGGTRLIASYLSVAPAFELLELAPAVIGYMITGYFFLGPVVRADLSNILRRHSKAQ